MKARTADRIALLIAIVGLFVSAYIADDVYEHIPHIEDEFAFLWEAQVMAGGEISLPSPENERSFLVPFVVDHQGQRFGKYPPGWPATLSLGARLDAAGWVNPLFAALTLWLTYRLARKMLNPALSVLAQILTLSSPMFLMLSGTLMAHMLSLFLALAFIVSWSDLFLEIPADAPVPNWLKVAVAGGSIGLLFLTRPLTAFAVALPFGIHGILLYVRASRRVRAGLISIFVLGAAIAAVLLLWQFALTGDVFRNPYTLWWSYDRIGFGPGFGVTESGHNLSWGYYNTRFSLRAGLHDLFGWPYLSWVLLPFGLIGMYRNKSAWLHAGTLVSLILSYSLYWIGSWLFGPRYYFEALAGLAILSAGGFGWIGGWLTNEQWATHVRRLMSLASISVFMLTNVIFYIPRRVGGMKGLYQIERQSSARFIVEKPDQTLIIIESLRWFLYARHLYQVEPFAESALLIAWSRGVDEDENLMRFYPLRDVYRYDVETNSLALERPAMSGE